MALSTWSAFSPRPTVVDPETLDQLKVIETIKDGRTVYERGPVELARRVERSTGGFFCANAAGLEAEPWAARRLVVTCRCLLFGDCLWVDRLLKNHEMLLRQEVFRSQMP